MRRFIENYSSCLSFLTILLAVVTGWVIVQLEGRATWSGDKAPEAWLAVAKPSDVFAVPGREISYWGDPAAQYSKYATRKRRPPIAVIVHYTAVKPVKRLVRYGHMRDPNRGNASFGYHFYVGRDGNIVQGAPLSRRTNHIKFKTNKQRRATARHLWSGNTIALTLVGGCDPLMRPRWGQWQRCAEEFVTKEQLLAGLDVIRALQRKFAMKCHEVYGHGDLQFDRESFEGKRLSRLARQVCKLENESEPPQPDVAAQPEVAAKAGHATAAATATAEKTSKPNGGT